MSGLTHSMRTPTLQPVPESLPADHVSAVKKPTTKVGINLSHLKDCLRNLRDPPSKDGNARLTKYIIFKTDNFLSATRMICACAGEHEGIIRIKYAET